MKTRLPGHSTPAFTLLELLVVMAIIMLLAGLSLRALTRAKSSAKSTQCLSQLRQIGLAMNSFAGDHSRFPWQTPASDGGTLNAPFGIAHWLAVSEHLGSLAILRCPADRRQFKPAPDEPGRVVQFSYCAEMNSDPAQPASIVAADLNLNDLVYYPNTTATASWVPEDRCGHGAGQGQALLADGSTHRLTDSKLRQTLAAALRAADWDHLGFSCPEKIGVVLP